MSNAAINSSPRPLDAPAHGPWQIVPGSHLAIAPAPDAPPAGTAIHSGQLNVAPAIEDTELHLALGRRGLVRFTGHALTAEPTSYGCVEWAVRGRITCETESAPMELTLGYQGIDRHGGRAWAWFTGRGSISPDGEETREVVADLLFEAP